ncbi:MAG: hypothetical protein JJ896_03065 [Rhodothermales bacterium]|nr:hypothetical protein [Rhodothermales bacterium]MBO6778613.1 hypothetical protein [Rhodothermales bacterium]
MRSLLLLVAAGLLAPAVQAQSPPVPSPEQFFGHEMGADRKLARWDRLVEYYELLDASSDRLTAVNVGPSTMGNPFLVLFITSPENMARLDELKAINALLSDPRGATQEELEIAVDNGKAVIVQSYGLHSSEVAGAQTPAELTWEMVTRQDEDMLRILDNTIAIMIPCFNPDGEIMVTDWYNETVGTPYEGSGLPYLYHKYIGHDNNRDAFMQNTIESVYGAELMFREWIPQAYVDHHQMGAYGPRLSLPPYAEPTRPGADPLVWREMSWYGAHMAYREEEAGMAGVIGAAIYSGWGHFGFHWITPFHNIAGMLTESASARMATPLYVHPDQLRGSRGFPEYEEQTTFPNPWEGGWWRIRDIVVQQKIASIATLDIAARNRETVLRNAYRKALNQTARGAAREEAAYLIPADQHDPLTMRKMIDKLLGQGIEVHHASQPFTHESRVYGAGSYAVSMAQPKMGVIRWLLGRTYYPDNTFTRQRDGSPLRPYDMTTDNISEFMGVTVHAAGSMPEGLNVVASLEEPRGRIAVGSQWLLDARLNDSFRALNMVWDAGGSAARTVDTGDFVVSLDAGEAGNIALETGVDFRPVPPGLVTNPVRRQQVGMYQPYYGGNMDEGWSRLVFETFGFPYETIRDADVTGGRLDRFDVIVLPTTSLSRMMGDETPEDEYGRGAAAYPPEYRSGFGRAGADSLESWVLRGGRLVTFADAGDLPLTHFDLPITNVIDGVPSTEFYAPGATLRVRVEPGHALTYGMPKDALAILFRGGQVYRVDPTGRNDHIERLVTFRDRDILHSGWLIGEDHIAEKAALVRARYGLGDVVLIGFRAQHRMQTHGTFKFVFNALVGD